MLLIKIIEVRKKTHQGEGLTRASLGRSLVSLSKLLIQISL